MEALWTIFPLCLLKNSQKLQKWKKANCIYLDICTGVFEANDVKNLSQLSKSSHKEKSCIIFFSMNTIQKLFKFIFVFDLTNIFSLFCNLNFVCMIFLSFLFSLFSTKEKKLRNGVYCKIDSSNNHVKNHEFMD